MRDFQDDIPILVNGTRRKRSQGTTGQERPVVYVRIRCPQCHGDRIPVQHTDPVIGHRRVRHHRCESCRLSFKSVEVIPEGQG